MSAVEQNFNPSVNNINRQNNLGYPRLLSGDLDLSTLTRLPNAKQKTLFPENDVDVSYSKMNWVKKYYLKFPFYPFRTLCPREVNMSTSKSNEFDNTSPVFPANTQINFVFQKRKKKNFLKYMLPLKLDPSLGTNSKELTAEQFAQTLTFTAAPATGAAVGIRYVITRVDIDVKDMYMQVSLENILIICLMLFIIRLCLDYPDAI